MANPDRVALALAADFSDPDPRTWTRDGCMLTLDELEQLAELDADDMDAAVSLLRTDLEMAKAASLESVRELGRLAGRVLQRLRDEPNWLA